MVTDSSEIGQVIHGIDKLQQYMLLLEVVRSIDPSYCN